MHSPYTSFSCFRWILCFTVLYYISPRGSDQWLHSSSLSLCKSSYQLELSGFLIKPQCWKYAYLVWFSCWILISELWTTTITVPSVSRRMKTNAELSTHSHNYLPKISSWWKQPVVFVPVTLHILSPALKLTLPIEWQRFPQVDVQLWNRNTSINGQSLAMWILSAQLQFIAV